MVGGGAAPWFSWFHRHHDGCEHAPCLAQMRQGPRRIPPCNLVLARALRLWRAAVIQSVLMRMARQELLLIGHHERGGVANMTKEQKTFVLDLTDDLDRAPIYTHAHTHTHTHTQVTDAHTCTHTPTCTHTHSQHIHTTATHNTNTPRGPRPLQELWWCSGARGWPCRADHE